MTLIIYAQCADGTIIISDRKESFGTGDSEFTKKTYLYEKKDFLLSLSGHGLRINIAISTLEVNPKITSDNIQKKLSTLLGKNNNTFPLGDVDGLLVIMKNNKKIFYEIHATDNYVTVTPSDTKLRCFGTPDGATMARFFIRKYDIEKLSWPKACELLIAVMDVVSERFETIGNLKDGFDILVLANNGEIYEQSQYCDPSCKKLKIEFELDSSNNFVNSFSKIVSIEPEEVEPEEVEPEEVEIVEKIPTVLEIVNLKEDPPPNSYLITNPTCIECGNELQPHEGTGFLNHGKCNNCSNKTYTITGSGLGTSKCTECGNDYTSGVLFSSLGKCSDCSNKGLVISGLASKCTECGNELQPHEGTGFLNHGKCNNCSNKTYTITGSSLGTSTCTQCGKELGLLEVTRDGKCSQCSGGLLGIL